MKTKAIEIVLNEIAVIARELNYLLNPALDKLLTDSNKKDFWKVLADWFNVKAGTQVPRITREQAKRALLSMLEGDRLDGMEQDDCLQAVLMKKYLIQHTLYSEVTTSHRFAKFIRGVWSDKVPAVMARICHRLSQEGCRIMYEYSGSIVMETDLGDEELIEIVDKLLQELDIHTYTRIVDEDFLQTPLYEQRR
jgi:hypothetical protein